VAVRDLAMIGLDRIGGYFSSAVIDAWGAAGRELGSVPQVTIDALAERLRRKEVTVIDVRGRAEWESGHLPGVANIPVGYLAERIDEIPRDRPVVMQCQSGARSAIAASVLRAKGLANVSTLLGGFADWSRAGLPVDVSPGGA
jgi:hydroxyacylglutathione hydrolase